MYEEKMLDPAPDVAARLKTGNRPVEQLGDETDDGTMPQSLANLTDAVVGHRIVRAERERIELRKSEWWMDSGDWLVLTLDNGKRVVLEERSDCCAGTNVTDFLLHADKIEHAITGVATEDGYNKWFILADFGDVMEFSVSWSCGNPFYYGYGFDIHVVDLPTIDSREVPDKELEA